MNLSDLEQKLLAAAREEMPGDAVPYSFEKRVSALVASRPRVDIWDVWSRALWRAAAPCVAVAVLLGAWSLVAADGPVEFTDPGQSLEQTLLSAAMQDSGEAAW